MKLFNTVAEANAHKIEYEQYLSSLDTLSLFDDMPGLLSSPEQAKDYRKKILTDLIRRCEDVTDE
jgi:hypothetical protein